MQTPHKREKRMDIRQMRYFVACVDAGSLSKAALALSISQPSLSQQIAEMESDLGVPLLVRSYSGVAPTEAGVTLYRHAQSIIRQIAQMRGDVKRGEHALSGQVAVGLPTAFRRSSPCRFSSACARRIPASSCRSSKA